MKSKLVMIPNVKSKKCIATISSELIKIDGLMTVSGYHDKKVVIFQYVDPADWDTIKSKLTDIGYPPAE